MIFSLNVIELSVNAFSKCSFIIFIEKLVEKYPDESQFAVDRVRAYLRLEKFDKVQQIADKNYKEHKGNISIDTLYGRLKLDEHQSNLRQEIFGEFINPHEIYPQREAFSEAELIEYFTLQSLFQINEANYEKARKLADTLIGINEEASMTRLLLLTDIYAKENPGKLKRRRFALWAIIIIVAGLAIWGIVALVQWIFGLF